MKLQLTVSKTLSEFVVACHLNLPFFCIYKGEMLNVIVHLFANHALKRGICLLSLSFLSSPYAMSAEQCNLRKHSSKITTEIQTN